MPTKIDFRDCVHQGIAGPTPEHILASIRAEYCLPPVAGFPAVPRSAAAPAAIRPEDFPALERALGAAALRQLMSDFRRWADGKSGFDDLPEFLAQHRYGRATAALVDLARLERALAVSERAPHVSSIGACCLPPPLLRAHPDLTLAFHPAWQWLDLGTPADQWRAALLGHDATTAPPLPRITRLSIHPEHGRIATHRLQPAEFAFERALLAAESLQAAEAAARRLTPDFDPMQALQGLLMAGAVVDADLHPARPANHPSATTQLQQPSQDR